MAGDDLSLRSAVALAGQEGQHIAGPDARLSRSQGDGKGGLRAATGPASRPPLITA